VAIYANNEKAISKLGWKINYAIEDMMRTAWAWEKEVQLKESIAKN
jgi:UDP-glucose 4-epimerase